MIRALAAAIGLLCLVSALCWHLGGELHDTGVRLKAKAAELTVCESQRGEAVKATQDWSTLYNADMKAKDAAYAQQIEDLRAKTKATCAAQFDAGYRYGRSVATDQPVGVRGQADDFGEYWVGQTKAR